MVRRSTRSKNTTARYSPEPATQHPRPKSSKRKGVLRAEKGNDTTSRQPAQGQTPEERLRALRLMPKEWDAVVGLGQLKLGANPKEARERELARLEVEDPIAHYYAQTKEERAPHALEAACILYQMSGGDIREPVAALTTMKTEKEKQAAEERKAGAMLLAMFRVCGESLQYLYDILTANTHSQEAKAKQEAEGAAEMVQEKAVGLGARKRELPAEEAAVAEQPPKKRSVRFARE